jgi:protein-S-isoprenylcysteine O-methyltransferase Ste14
MNISLVDSIIRFLGELFAFITLGIVFYGIWRGGRRQVGRTVGLAGFWLRSAWFYFIASAIFFFLSYIGWIPLPWNVSPPARWAMLAIGALLYFPGISLVLWGRLALGKNYFVSTGFGAQLFAGQQLVTTGPFAIVRHPMYIGLILAAFGGLLIYVTWTMLVFACLAPLVLIRAWREEQALAAEFGEQWKEYCKRVPAFLPKLWR